jgi:hypothetical protein
MVRNTKVDAALGAATIVALALAAYFAARFGDLYRSGVTEHHRTTIADVAAVAAPLAVACACVFVAVARRVNPDGFSAEWRRERQELRDAKAHAGLPG